MSRPWLVLAVLVGCGNTSNGLLFQFDATDVTHVELFIATGPVNTSSSITPPSVARPTVSGTRYVGMGWVIDPKIATVDATGSFQLMPASAGSNQSTVDTISALLVVAYDHNWVPLKYAVFHDLDVPANGQETIVIDNMMPFTALADTGDGLQVWGEASDAATHAHASCAVIRNAGSIEFFAPSDDSDCDEASYECAPFVFNDDSGPDPSHLTCVTSQTTTGICRLGGVGCVDGVPPPTSPVCMPATGEPYCVPPDMCSSGDSSCGPIDSPCFTNDGRSSTMAIHCAVATMSVDGPCTAAEVTSIPIALTAIAPVCTGVKIASASGPLVFGSSAMIGGAAVSLPTQITSGCATTLSYTPTSQATFGSIGLLDIPVPAASGQTVASHFVVPIVFTSVTTGTCAMTCDPAPVGNPAQYTCQ